MRTVKTKNQLKRLRRVAGLTNNLINRWRCAACANCQPALKEGQCKSLRGATREKVPPPTQPSQLHPFSQEFWCPLRLEKGEASQELGGLLRPSPSHCGGEDHQPRATPCPAELREGPLLSSPCFFQDLLTTERNSLPGSSVAVQW